jgi:hypothetical protein
MGSGNAPLFGMCECLQSLSDLRIGALGYWSNVGALALGARGFVSPWWRRIRVMAEAAGWRA